MMQFLLCAMIGGLIFMVIALIHGCLSTNGMRYSHSISPEERKRRDAKRKAASNSRKKNRRKK